MAVCVAVGELQPEDVHLRPGGFGNRQRRVGGVEHAGEPFNLTAGVARGDEVFDLDVDEVPHLERVATVIVDVVDRRRLHAQRLPDKRVQHGHRTTHLSAEDRTQLFGLLGGGGRIYDHSYPPVALTHQLRGVGHHNHRLVVHTDAVDLAAGDVKGQHHAAALLVGGHG